ncbi:hypothetical protein AVEN_219613-1 [Araneus ventricosus]|uniref:Uncharacterized protein n=1 Tax=Araneus ventricosus TaxID=182803 RepID=A0A4Y2UF40_ARAVE|nr:hypothetical protein AVEN_36354-1 [Araneus ventricosus]GBO11428.1 hypothetical protein AVEN_11557-1 [Araneus ventricosus]GBO11577.1 hypothetical protein AVEN_219613-1 [Araneus ventricosus]
MPTVMEEYTLEHQSALCFLWAKGLPSKDIDNEMLPVYIENYLLHQAIYNLDETISKECSKLVTFSYTKYTKRSIVIVKKFELEILTNLHVLDLPKSEKHNFGIMSVCLSVNTITRKVLELRR